MSFMDSFVWIQSGTFSMHLKCTPWPSCLFHGGDKSAWERKLEAVAWLDLVPFCAGLLGPRRCWILVDTLGLVTVCPAHKQYAVITHRQDYSKHIHSENEQVGTTQQTLVQSNSEIFRAGVRRSAILEVRKVIWLEVVGVPLSIFL